MLKVNDVIESKTNNGDLTLGKKYKVVDVRFGDPFVIDDTGSEIFLNRNEFKIINSDEGEIKMINKTIIVVDENKQGWLDTFNEYNQTNYEMNQEIDPSEIENLNHKVIAFNNTVAYGPAIDLVVVQEDESSLNNYQKLASRTANDKVTQKEALTNYALGIAGESGEVADMVKKHVFHNHELDKEEIVKELGDVMWYVANIATCLDVDLFEIANKNIDKLKKRYPEGFDTEKSKNRKEYQEGE